MKALSLVVRRRIRAPLERVFAAWTEPQQLQAWWGPGSMRCSAAEVDLRVGGAYAIANLAPDGTEVWIRGRFQVVERPRRLVYTWRTRGDGPEELVTVQFDPAEGDETDVTVLHERVDPADLAGHEAGWNGCLDGLANWAP